MKVYQCRRCGVVVKKDSMPTSSGCPSGGSHSWTNLGKVGSRMYQCRKCGTAVETDSMPSSSGCPDGGSHSWTRL